MKKFFTSFAIALFACIGAQAQSIVINKTDGTSVTYQASEISSINFQPAQQNSIAGSYTGKDSVNVGKMFPYTSAAEVTYQVTENSDGTVNLLVPEVEYDQTVMGTLYLGSYSIKNIPYDETQKAYVKAYKNDNVVFHFKSVDTNGKTTIDKDYTFDKDVCQVIISKDADGVLTVSNTYQMGSMPFVIYGTFRGK